MVTQPEYVLRFQPPLTISNLLPFDITVRELVALLIGCWTWHAILVYQAFAFGLYGVDTVLWQTSAAG